MWYNFLMNAYQKYCIHITDYTELPGFVVQGPRALQCLTLSENFESS